VIDGACGQGAARDGRVSAFHRVEYTPPHPLFSNTLTQPLDNSVFFQVEYEHGGLR